MTSAEEYKNIGNQEFKEGNYEKAIENYTLAISIDPNNCIYYSNRAGAFINKGDLEQGLKDAEKCLELDSKFIKGYLRKGLA